MTYRGEEDAQRARVAELEKELDAAKRKIAVLEGAGDEASPGTVIARSRISGGPTRYEREMLLPYAIDEEGYEAIAKVLRTRLRLNAAQVGRTLTVPSVFTLEREGGGTRIRLVGDWRSMPAGVVAATLLTGGFGTMMSAGAMADILSHGLGWHHSLAVDSAFTAAVVTVATTLTVGAAWLTRRSTSRNGAQLLADFDGTFAAILELAEQHAVRELPKTRVAESENESENESPVRRAQRATPRD